MRKKIRIKRKQMHRPIIFFAVLIIIIIIIVNMIGAAKQDEDEAVPLTEDSYPVQVSVIDRSSDHDIDDNIVQLLSEYFETYYTGLGSLNETDVKEFYDTENLSGYESAVINQSALDYLIAYRTASVNDLRFSTCTVGLMIEDVEIGSDGNIELTLVQDETVSFAYIEPISSSISGTEHVFVLTSSDDGYQILTHSVEETSFLMINEELQKQKSVAPYGSKQSIDTLVRGIASELKERASFQLDIYADMLSEYNDAPDNNSSTLLVDHDYNRNAAVSYAQTWVDPINSVRNEDVWSVYDYYGGNCNNYVSQCLIAGGIPMDTSGDNIWKWYGDITDNTSNKTGRSSSWTGVNSFYEYCMNNDGYGLVASVGQNLYSGQIGDVVIMTSGDVWSHVLIITGIVTDEHGNVLDYLINSNTSDRIDYPLSAYGNIDLDLIKIFGWND